MGEVAITGITVPEPLRRLARAPAKHIRWKIILPYALLVAVLAGAQTYLTTSLVQGSLDERFENQLLEAGRSAEDSIVRREEAHLEVARTVAFSQGLAQAIESGDRAGSEALIHAIGANTASERIEVVDDRGERVAGVQLTDAAVLEYASTAGADDPSQWPLVQRVLEGDGSKAAQVVETATGAMLLTASPVFDNDGMVGAVVVGTSLETLAAEMKADALADLTLYDFNGRPIGSTFVLDAEQADLNASPQVVAPAVDQVVRESRVIWGRRYDLVYGDISIEGQPVAYYSAALPSDFIFDAGNENRWQITIIFGAGMAMVLGIGLLLARSLTRRIQQLVATARRVTEGDLTARTEAASEDELGQLAGHLNRMTDRLEGQYMATMRALASAVAGLNPYTIRHSRRVGELATLLGQELGADESTLSQLEIGGYLHDVGKIGVRDLDIAASGGVTAARADFIDSHPHIGFEAPETGDVRAPVMDFIGGRNGARAGAGGTGPDQFDIIGRIVAVADLYDALTADRPHGDPMTSEEAMEVLSAAAVERLLHFGTVEALARLLPKWERSQGRGSDYRELVAEGA